MPDAAGVEAIRGALLAAADAVVAAQDRLTKADQAIGDGDHGVGMARGFRAAREAVEARPAATPGELVRAVGMAILSKSGGASGAIFGTFFIGAAPPLGAATVDGAAYAAAIEAGLDAVRKRGGASPGDKTVIDALTPAAAAAQSQAAAGVGAAAAAAAAGAERGVDETRAMVARFGKAKALGERCLGHPDPGAITISIVLRALADTLAAAPESA